MVSIIIPAYNVQDYIAECLDSVCKQDYKDIEALVVDDGSTDNTGAICDQYAQRDKRIKVIHQENKGLSGARNTALDIATGEYIMFIDSDDFVTCNFVSHMVNIMDEEQHADMGVFGFFNYTQQDNGIYVAQPCVTKPEQYRNNGNDLIIKKYGKTKVYYEVPFNKIWRSKSLGQLRYPVGRICEDAWLSLELYLQCREVICVEEHLYYYRKRAGSISSAPTYEYIKAQLDYLERDMDYFFTQKNNQKMRYPAQEFMSILYKYRKLIKTKEEHKRYVKVAVTALKKAKDISLIKRAQYTLYGTYFCIG